MKSEFLSRRNFLRLTGATAGSVVVSKTLARADSPLTTNKLQKTKTDIIYRTLGRTGLRLPIVSLGVMRVDNPNLIRVALDEGIVHLDTAHGYQNGRNEEMLGKFLKDRPRDSFVISTKINPRGKQLSYDEFIEMFELSLERLQMDYVDILYLHAMKSREATLNETYLKALKDLKKEGKARFLGVSTHDNMPEVIKAVVESKVYDIVLTSYNFKMTNWEEMNQSIASAAKAGIGIIGMKTMAGIYWDKEKTRPINTKAALKWVLQNENIHTTIPGSIKYEELEANLGIMRDISMTKEEIEDLKEDKNVSGIFCTGCNECAAGCKKGLPLPDLMRAYMYAYAYRDLSLAREVVDNSYVTGNPCEDCDVCTVSCSQGFNIVEKTSDIIRIKEVPYDFLNMA